MIIKLVKIEVQSRKDMEMVDITDRVQETVRESGVRNGVVNIFNMHTSAGIIVTEGLECLEADILRYLDTLAPEGDQYLHNRYLDIDGRVAFNAPSHLKSVLTGYTAFFPIEDGNIVKGSRQRIYFAEFDGPLCRSCCIQVLGE